jgi:hypothetical protein
VAAGLGVVVVAVQCSRAVGVLRTGSATTQTMIPWTACASVNRWTERTDVPGGRRGSLAGHLWDTLPLTLSGSPAAWEAQLNEGASAATRYSSNAWLAEYEQDGFVDEFRRRWGTGGTAEVTEFRNHQAALDFNEWANRFSCRYSDQAFRVGDVPGSIGLRINYSSGQVQERVSFVRGRRRFAVSIYTDGPPPDHSRVIAFALKVARTAE